MNNLNLMPALPEIFLSIAIVGILLIDLFLSDAKRHITYGLSILALLVCAAMSWSDYAAGTTVYTFNNMFVSDPMSNLLKIFSYIAIGLTLVYSRRYVIDRQMMNSHLGGEFYVLALFTLLGQMVMISANNLLIIYLGLEMMSLPLYALVALRRDNALATEAAMKYFILGALASGFLLYGISMLYGATGSLDLGEIARAGFSGTVNKPVLIFGLVFIVCGLAFKLGAVPFHMWVPDVYEGAPTAVTLLLGGAPEIAAFAMAIRLLVEALPALTIDWQQMLTILAVLSIAIGNITAIVQTNIKRMLAYSAISQIGFMLLGILSGVVTGADGSSNNGYGAAMFYILTYVLTTLGVFGVIMLLARVGFEADNIDDFKGLNQRSPWFALIMMILMFSLAGVPPVVGFYAKLSVLQAVLSTGQVWLAVFAVLFSLIGAYYYLRVVKVMYFDDPIDTEKIVSSADVRVALSLNGLAILVLGILPGSLMAACSIAIAKTLAS